MAACSCVSSVLCILGVIYALKFVYFVFIQVRLLIPNRILKAEDYSVDQSKPTWAIVTGCTSGIGESLALELASAGFSLILISRSIDQLQVIESLVKSKYESISTECIAVDLSSKEFCSTIEPRIQNKQIAVLCNNAGLSFDFPMNFECCSVDSLEAILNVNIRATVLLSRLVLPLMLKRASKRKGIVINVGSLAGSLGGSPLLSVYGASKAFVESFSLSLFTEYERQGIQIFCSIPGYVVSKMSKIRKESLTVISPQYCATKILSEVAMQPPVPSGAPHWSHAFLLAFLNFLPERFRMDRIYAAHKVINAKALSKRK